MQKGRHKGTKVASHNRCSIQETGYDDRVLPIKKRSNPCSPSPNYALSSSLLINKEKAVKSCSQLKTSGPICIDIEEPKDQPKMIVVSAVTDSVNDMQKVFLREQKTDVFLPSSE